MHLLSVTNYSKTLQENPQGDVSDRRFSNLVFQNEQQKVYGLTDFKA